MNQDKFNPKFEMGYDPKSGGYISVYISNQPIPLSGNHRLLIPLEKATRNILPVSYKKIRLDNMLFSDYTQTASTKTKEAYEALLKTLTERVLENFDRDKELKAKDKGTKGTLIFYLNDCFDVKKGSNIHPTARAQFSGHKILIGEHH